MIATARGHLGPGLKNEFTGLQQIQIQVSLQMQIQFSIQQSQNQSESVLDLVVLKMTVSILCQVVDQT